MRILCIVALLCVLAGLTCAQSPPGSGPQGTIPQTTYTTLPTGNSSSSTSASPIINVNAYGASPLLADNATAFTAAAAAYNAASQMASNPSIVTSGVQSCTSCTANVVTVNLTAGDSALVWIIGAVAGRTFTFSGTSTFKRRIVIPASGAGSSVQLYATEPGQIAATVASLTVTDSGAAENVGVVVVDARNVGSYRFTTVLNQSGGGTTTPTITDTTLDTNNILVSAYAWFVAGGASAVQNTGTLLQTFPSNGTTTAGGAVVTQSSATSAALTNNITLSASSPWSAEAVELRSRNLTWPTLYIPPGTYYYSSGLNLQEPGVLQCEPGSGALFYTGSAHAVDLGYTGQTQQTMRRRYQVEGCLFAGGINMTQGIFVNTYVTLATLRNNTFKNFGSASSSYAISGQCQNWDLDVGPNNAFYTDDYIPRNLVQENVGGCDTSSFLRFHDNIVACWEGENTGNNGGCQSTEAGIGVVTDSPHSRVYHNNIAFFNPDILHRCSNTPCHGTNDESNQLETATDASATCPIQFTTAGGNDALLIINNTVNLHAETLGFVCPATGADTLTGSVINFNKISNIPDATPVVRLNNVVGQTGNLSIGNRCATSFVPSKACVTPHTTGANIVGWQTNNDDSFMASGTKPTLTGTGACATITTQLGSWAGKATCTGTTGASTFIITPGSTALNGWQCDSADLTAGTALPQSASSATACTVTGTVNQNDVVTFKAVAY